MKKVKRRMYSILMIVAGACILLVVFLFRLAADGEAWATFPTNQNIFRGGQLTIGSIYDRHGVPLVAPQDGIAMLHSDPAIRRGVFHAVGDLGGNIVTGVRFAYARELVGYNMVRGLYSFRGEGGTIHLTLDAQLNRIATEALGGRHGAIVVFNYETGDVIVNVSSPGYDPLNRPQFRPDDPAFDGVYLNRVLSSTFTPGSTFKVVTAAAAIHTFPDALTRTFECTGALNVEGNLVTCMGVHGHINLEQAMGHSCNPFFAQLALDLGGSLFARYVDQLGLTDSIAIDRISTAPGQFAVGQVDSALLAWSGVGQGEVLASPMAMAHLMGTIARGGTPIEPRIIDRMSGGIPVPFGNRARVGDEVMTSRVANDLAIILRATVVNYYGNHFPGLSVAGKTGTAEVGEGRAPHAWFVGFLDDPNHPYAFAVFVENGGGGLAVAGVVANTVLQAAVR